MPGPRSKGARRCAWPQNTVGARPYQATPCTENLRASSCISPQRMPRSLTWTSATPGRGGDPLQDERSGQDHVGAARIEADDPLARRLRPDAQAGDLLGQCLLRQPVAVHAGGVVADQRLGHRGQRGHRPRHADQRRWDGAGRWERDPRQRGVDGGGDGGDLVEAGRIVVDEALGQPDRPERQADVERDLAAGGDHDLRRAAADVDHREYPGQGVGKGVRDRPKRERRLARAVDHFDRSVPRISPAGSRNAARVRGAPQRLGADGRDLRLVPARDGRELPQAPPAFGRSPRLPARHPRRCRGRDG